MRESGSKIKELKALLPVIQKQRAAGKKIVLGHGVFDLLHYGHIHYLKQARKLGDILAASVVMDRFIKKGPNRPVFTEKIRLNSVAALECVDYVIPCQNYGPWEIIRALKPDIYVKGEDAVQQLSDPASGVNKDKRVVEAAGGTIQFTQSLPIHSTELLKKYFGNFSPEVNNFLAAFRKKYPVDEVLAKVEQLKTLQVLVIGEAIIDEYRYVTPLGKPSKANIISAHYAGKEEFAGGALACANHIASICGQVDLVTYLGEIDSKTGFIRRQLKRNIKPTFFYCPGQPTIVKRRFVDPAYYHKLFEEYIFDKNFLPTKVEDRVAKFLLKNLRKYDLVIVVDYGHGFLSDNLIKILGKHAKFLAVNTQTNSGNSGFNFIHKYNRADYACVDELEARLAAQDNISRVEDVLLKLTKQMSVGKLIVTMGHRGSIAFQNGSGNGRIFKSTPSFATRVTDPMGAGDAFLAISSPCAAANLPLELVSFIGNVAGAIAVGIPGNKTFLEREELMRHLSYLLE